MNKTKQGGWTLLGSCMRVLHSSISGRWTVHGEYFIYSKEKWCRIFFTSEFPESSARTWIKYLIHGMHQKVNIIILISCSVDFKQVWEVSTQTTHSCATGLKPALYKDFSLQFTELWKDPHEGRPRPQCGPYTFKLIRHIPLTVTHSWWMRQLTHMQNGHNKLHCPQVTRIMAPDIWRTDVTQADKWKVIHFAGKHEQC